MEIHKWLADRGVALECLSTVSGLHKVTPKIWVSLQEACQGVSEGESMSHVLPIDQAAAKGDAWKLQ